MNNFCASVENDVKPSPPSDSTLKAKLARQYFRLRCGILLNICGVLLQASMSTLPTEVDYNSLCISFGTLQPSCQINQAYKLRLFVEMMAALGGISSSLIFVGRHLMRRRPQLSCDRGGCGAEARRGWFSLHSAVRSVQTSSHQVVSSGSLPSALSNKTEKEDVVIAVSDCKGPATMFSAAMSEEQGGLRGGPRGKSVKVSHSVRLYQPRPRPVKFLWTLASLMHCVEFSCIWRLKGQVSSTMRLAGLVVSSIVTAVSVIGALIIKSGIAPVKFGHTMRQLHVSYSTQITLWVVGVCATISSFGPYMASPTTTAIGPESVRTILWSWSSCLVMSVNFCLTSLCLKRRPDLVPLLAAYASFWTLITLTLEYTIIVTDDARTASIPELVGDSPYGYYLPLMAAVGGFCTSYGSACAIALGSACLGFALTLIAMGSSILIRFHIMELHFTRLQYSCRILPVGLLIWILARPDLFFSLKLVRHMQRQLEYNKQWSLTKSPLEGRVVHVNGDVSNAHIALVTMERQSRLQYAKRKRQRRRSTTSSRSHRAAADWPSSSAASQSGSSRSSSLARSGCSRSPSRSPRYSYKDTKFQWNAYTYSLRPSPSTTSRPSSPRQSQTRPSSSSITPFPDSVLDASI